MSFFRSKKLDLGGFVNIRAIRDHTKRKAFEQYEPERYDLPCTELERKDVVAWLQALRYIIRNTSLPQRTRAQAQLQLTQMHAYTRPTQIKNRCVAGGIARGIIRDFRIARYQFREQALAGDLPGVKKASW
ncbi:40S ribosomal protein mrp2, mitochondrial [Aspergillus melleus]|uniref:40S ribosomal protein mrp2, mitochondrial n=1 Tax=Aspergillus melleus TaxID=138277 RepID=A0ACC3B9T1_9EURO|nr:40S ribosomal protein mrp2, mitochondrial [Aspergillus melleus]